MGVYLVGCSFFRRFVLCWVFVGFTFRIVIVTFLKMIRFL